MRRQREGHGFQVLRAVPIEELNTLADFKRIAAETHERNEAYISKLRDALEKDAAELAEARAEIAKLEQMIETGESKIVIDLHLQLCANRDQLAAEKSTREKAEARVSELELVMAEIVAADIATDNEMFGPSREACADLWFKSLSKARAILSRQKAKGGA